MANGNENVGFWHDFANSDTWGVNLDRRSKCSSVDQSFCPFRNRIKEKLPTQELARPLNTSAFGDTNVKLIGRGSKLFRPQSDSETVAAARDSAPLQRTPE
jgi:hypothetical protein